MLTGQFFSPTFARRVFKMPHPLCSPPLCFPPPWLSPPPRGGAGAGLRRVGSGSAPAEKGDATPLVRTPVFEKTRFKKKLPRSGRCPETAQRKKGLPPKSCHFVAAAQSRGQLAAFFSILADILCSLDSELYFRTFHTDNLKNRTQIQKVFVGDRPHFTTFW